MGSEAAVLGFVWGWSRHEIMYLLLCKYYNKLQQELSNEGLVASCSFPYFHISYKFEETIKSRDVLPFQ